MVKLRKSHFINWKNEILSVSIDFPNNLQEGKKYPFIIICHGFIGSKVGVDRLFVKAAEELVQNQTIVLRFDFVGCGESSGEYGKTGMHDLVDQLKTVLAYSIDQIKQIDTEKITLIGHSLGGATALLVAAKDQRIRHLVLWSSVANPYEDLSRIIGNEKMRALKKGSSVEYMGYLFEKRFFSSLIEFHPLQAATEFTGNVLILHGTGDEDIPVSYAKEYEAAFNSRKMGSCICHEISDANHTISNYHHFTELITNTKNWMNHELFLQTV